MQLIHPGKITQIVSSLSLLTLLFSVGCGHSAEPKLTAEEGRLHHLDGNLTKQIEELQSSEGASLCDKQARDRQLEIAGQLDAREKEIEAVAKTQMASSFYRRVPLGPTFVREPTREIHPHVGWDEEINSWQWIYEEYSKIKNLPTDHDWVWLNSMVRALLVDDQDRILYGENFYLGKDSAAPLKLLRDAVSKCQAETACTQLPLSVEEEAFARSNPVFLKSLTEINQESYPPKKRDLIHSFSNRLSGEYKLYEFKLNPTVLRVSPTEIQLPLDAADFAGAETQLTQYIESVWQSPELRVKVKWEKTSEVSDVFKILLGDVTGGRAFVNYTHHRVHLFPNVRSKSIAHEIGHVLGIRDHYYTVWHPETCSYVVQSREDDLMSDSDYGSVTSEEWAVLSEKYVQ